MKTVKTFIKLFEVLLYTSIKLFETLAVIRIKHQLTKSNIFLDDESEDFDDKDFAVNRKMQM